MWSPSRLATETAGGLVATLYGHLEGKVARRRIREAWDRTAQVRPVRLVREGEAE